jgi:hypothetical protein
MTTRNYRRPSYAPSYPVEDAPERTVAAVIKQAVLDLESGNPRVRKEAHRFLYDTEGGLSWFSYFAMVSHRQILEFLNQFSALDSGYSSSSRDNL